ncbi:hypothetical protein PROVRUST_05547 [Providencia rustigianii DSM 4541]|uniref:Uncharacterized protein n=1 Tax=Providencia rustigianii DSM 4541 TaxID=500637 RepID=D1P038_9GAMM|nr:hypothetical protein PROVRUST_05547 [Providencia rustigianii DSM 4541]
MEMAHFCSYWKINFTSFINLNNGDDCEQGFSSRELQYYE